MGRERIEVALDQLLEALRAASLMQHQPTCARFRSQCPHKEQQRSLKVLLYNVYYVFARGADTSLLSPFMAPFT